MAIKRIEDVVKWQTLEGLEHFKFSILHIDERHERAEVLFQFDAFKPIILHRHCSLNKIVVLSGEHCIYDAKGQIKEVRATGSYTVVKPDDEPHAESGGEDGAVVLFSIFDNGGKPLYELLGPDQSLIGSLSMTDLVALNQAA